MEDRLGNLPPARPGPDRAAFAFPERVADAFRFLNERGFRVVAAETTYVRYESETVGISVYHGRSSYELGVEVELLAEAADTPSYPVAALAGVTNPKVGTEFYPYTARRPEQVAPGLARLAEQLRAHGAGALAGDPATFGRLAEQRRHRGHEMAREVQIAQVRQKGREAWRAHDYKRMVELLEPHRADLTDLERERLDYAKRQGGTQ